METADAKKLIGKMLRAKRLHRSLAEKRNKEADIHRSQLNILFYLSKQDAPPSQKELAAAFEVTPAAIAMSLKKMEQKGLIEREVLAEDTRVNLISVSENGKRIMESNRIFFEKIDRTMVEGVTDEEVAVLSRILDKFIDNLLKCGAEDDMVPFCKHKEN